MPSNVKCPNPACGLISPADEAITGRNVRCKKCGQPFVATRTLDGQQRQTKQNQPSSNTNPFPVLPAEFGRYRVLQLLGNGGMGAVYLAEDSHLGRQVALKMLYLDASESPQRVERFVREARLAAVLQHPNICTVFDAGEVDGWPFLTMMYIAGKTLEDEIDSDGPLPQTRAAEIARKIALALDHAHRKGIVHRDLKPANVMMTAEGEPVVMDFGLAKRIAEGELNEAKLTREGSLLGTPTYMSPEQVNGQTDAIGPATDIYSLGVLLFEMLTGNPPYSGPLGVVMGQILTAPVPSVREFRPEVDGRLEAICRQAMAKEPAARFPSMAALAQALGEYVTAPQPNPSSLAVPVQPVSVPKTKVQAKPQNPDLSRRKSKWPAVVGWIFAGMLGLLVAGTAILIHFRTRPSEVEKKEDVLTNSIGMKLTYIPPGTFSMGSPKEEKDRSEEEEQHEVELTKGFYLGVYEVTQEEYENLMSENPSEFSSKGDGKAKVAGVDTSRFPVERVSYEDAVKFCAKLSEMPEEKQKKRVYRLPTEAEWEYACRGGAASKTPFFFGNSLSSDLANFDGNYPYGGAAKGNDLERTCKVGSYKPNGFGLYDMHGNVWEWCSDLHAMDYYGKSPKRDPQGSSEGSARVFRGGSWRDGGHSCRSASRNRHEPTSRYSFLGFRVALDPSGQE
jgi:formylglycine-generating enzyme required for sulfatase activity/predicted Ser/Thr protein kinase